MEGGYLADRKARNLAAERMQQRLHPRAQVDGFLAKIRSPSTTVASLQSWWW
jgi:hypothetical protein